MKTNKKNKLGAYIKHLREMKSLSQQDLANSLGVPRPSISQIENGNRDVSLSEFSKLTEIFHIPPEELFQQMSGTTKKADTTPIISTNSKIKFSPEKFRNLLLYILEKCGSKPNVGETVIYKLLYFCDFDYFEIYEKPLTGMKYKKMQFGPVPQQTLYGEIIKSMTECLQLRIIKVPFINGYTQHRYINFVKPDLSLFNSQELELADKVINRLSDMNARQIEDHVHKDQPWIDHAMNEEIQYTRVFSRTGEFAQRDYDQEFLETGMEDAVKNLEPTTKEEYDYYMSLPEKDEQTRAR